MCELQWLVLRFNISTAPRTFLTAAALTTTGFTDFTATDPPGVVGCSDAPGASAAGHKGSRMTIDHRQHGMA